MEFVYIAGFGILILAIYVLFDLGSRFPCLALALALAVPARAEFVERKFTLTEGHAAKHLAYSAGATFAGATILRGMGLSPERANLAAGGAVFGVGLAKEFLVDGSPGLNDIRMDALGCALGALANVYIKF